VKKFILTSTKEQFYGAAKDKKYNWMIYKREMGRYKRKLKQKSYKR